MICKERIDRICRFCSIYRRYSDHQHPPASLRENPQMQINKKDWQSKSKMKVPMNLPPSCSNYSPPFLRLIDQTQLNIFLGSYNCICQYNFDLKLDLKWFALLKWSHTKSSFHHLFLVHTFKVSSQPLISLISWIIIHSNGAMLLRQTKQQDILSFKISNVTGNGVLVLRHLQKVLFIISVLWRLQNY